MSEVKLVVIYPRPKDIDSFEKIYLTEHVPMAVEKLGGKTKIVATKITGSPQGVPPFYRILEVYFPSKSASEARPGTSRTQPTFPHPAHIPPDPPPPPLL